MSATGRGPPGRSTSSLADDPLERRDLLADRGLRVAELDGRATEGALRLDRLECRQMAYLDAEPGLRKMIVFANGHQQNVSLI